MPGGIQTWKVKPTYGTYRSPYGPSYTVPFNLAGFDQRKLLRYSLWAAPFGAVAGLFTIFFFSDIPRVRKDIMQKMPVIGEHFIRDVPDSDNPF